MASKVIVMKGDQFQAQATADKVVVELEALRNQLSGVLGVRKTDDGVELPGEDHTVSPETKKAIVNHITFIRSSFMADKSDSNRGRQPKADLAALQRIYVEHRRSHRTQKNVAMAAMNVAIAYNANLPEDQQIDGGYVLRNAKANKWDDLIDVPQPEPVTA